jgi:hypothetical protein
LVFARIAALLKQKMGLDAESIGLSSVERAVGERLAARGLLDAQAYWEELCCSDAEVQELIEAIVIPETWFFRDPEAFGALGRVAREEWLPKTCGRDPAHLECAVLDRRGALLDCDGAPRRRLSAAALSHRRHRHQQPGHCVCPVWHL